MSEAIEKLIEEFREDAREEGRKEFRREAAMGMISSKRKYRLEEIAELTSLSLTEVLDLAKEMNAITELQYNKLKDKIAKSDNL